MYTKTFGKLKRRQNRILDDSESYENYSDNLKRSFIKVLETGVSILETLASGAGVGNFLVSKVEKYLKEHETILSQLALENPGEFVSINSKIELLEIERFFILAELKGDSSEEWVYISTIYSA